MIARETGEPPTTVSSRIGNPMDGLSRGGQGTVTVVASPEAEIEKVFPLTR
jgi:hypothetical protein